MTDRYAKYEGHTPGPWNMENAEILFGLIDHLEARANRNLVLDAPALLAENKRLREVLEEAQSVLADVTGDDPATRPHGLTLYARAVAAEAKARAALQDQEKPNE